MEHGCDIAHVEINLNVKELAMKSAQLSLSHVGFRIRVI